MYNNNETNKINGNYIYTINQQNQIPIQQQQPRPIIILTQPQYQQVIQFQPQNLQYNNNNNNIIINNNNNNNNNYQQIIQPIQSEKLINTDSDSDKKYICKYCNKRMNTVEKKCFNVCTCLFYIMCVLLFPFYIIFLIITRDGPTNCCECECFDKEYQCPYCGGVYETYKSCPFYHCC